MAHRGENDENILRGNPTAQEATTGLSDLGASVVHVGSAQSRSDGATQFQLTSNQGKN